VYTADSHGTLVLSTMGGYKENSLVGTAPDASYYLFITEDVASENPVEESLWVEAAERADSLESILSIPLWGILNLIIKHIITRIAK
jgi:hypothetical protein